MAQTCLEQSIFIFLGLRVLREHSVDQSKSHPVGSYKYFVLFKKKAFQKIIISWTLV